jgi:hypothetical protein
MLHDRQPSIRSPDSQLRQRIQQPLNKILSPATNKPGKLDNALLDAIVNIKRVIADKGRIPDQHLKQQNPQSPPIHILPIGLATTPPIYADQLGGQVFGGAADGGRAVVGQVFGEPEVAEEEVAVVIE